MGTPWDLLADSIMKNPKSIFQATVEGIYDHLVAEQRRAQEDLLNLCLWIITGHEFEKGNRVIFCLLSLSPSLSGEEEEESAFSVKNRQRERERVIPVRDDVGAHVV